MSPVALPGACIVASRALGETPPTGESTGTGLLRLQAGGLLHLLLFAASWSHLPVENLYGNEKFQEYWIPSSRISKQTELKSKATISAFSTFSIHFLERSNQVGKKT